jgi:hypothetical protein
LPFVAADELSKRHTLDAREQKSLFSFKGRRVASLIKGTQIASLVFKAEIAGQNYRARSFQSAKRNLRELFTDLLFYQFLEWYS